MATYAIGDLQGCAREFLELLERCGFGADDRLWLVGDLINRGPASLETLRHVHAISDQCEIVLGNHDLHFLAVYFGGHAPSKSDTFDELLAAPDIDELAHWLRRQNLLVRDGDWYMTHAGIPHVWELEQAASLAKEVEAVLRGDNSNVSYRRYFEELYGNSPDTWSETLKGMSRYRLITNYFTRMRLVDESGRLNFTHKGQLADAPADWTPWFELSAKKFSSVKILFGHWAALDGKTGYPHLVALDTGCVWGRTLTAFCLETGQVRTVRAITV